MSNRYRDNTSWRARWHDIIFEADTPAGRNFDIVLLVAILGSLAAIMLESVQSISEEYRTTFRYLEWFFTAIFTAEYILRLLVVHRKRHYIFSFYGIIDLLSILPTYLSMIFLGAHYFMAIRSLRLIRVFRVLKMVRFLGEAKVLSSALRASRIKITVFLVAVMCVIFIMGTVMYMVEGKENGFTSIPVSIYWCIVTLTTVGYGDISPQTPLGQVIASIIMILGYGIIAVPTGIVTAEMGKANLTVEALRECSTCGEQGHASNALYCRNCGSKL
ncbi:MAG TPA: ion transporter [Cryomorphaceae bacterium]|nr:ion transporter [Owenweeksia sp.]HBF22059.1 ion transporter [Cryomorphaceae bacterium]HCQ15237.1 ion transporter [Cryomorphaceae bacterium]